MEHVKVNCIVLDAVEDDFHPIWEVFSLLKKRMDNESDDQIVNLLVDSLNFLLKSGFINIYEGYSFEGEERAISNLITDREFVLKHLDDWRNTGYKGIDYRISISNEGVDFLVRNCKQEYFNK